MVTIRVAEVADEKLVAAYQRLTPQLSSSSPAPTAAELAEIIRSDSATVLIAEDDKGDILGSMTLVLFRIPTGVRAWIEDVVVDTEARGMGTVSYTHLTLPTKRIV